MPASVKPRVAVIGLGSMGFGMATSLRRAEFEVTGCDVSADSVKRFVADGGNGAGTPSEAAKAADIVVSVVVNAAQTETILFGPNGVAETLGKGAVFISSATMDPDVARRLAKQLEATGRHYLDAPISGGAQRAAQGELTILASGSPAAFAKARPALDAMAAKLYELGDDAGQAFGNGQPIDLRQLRTSSGVELRMVMPMLNVPFRLIYAWNVYRDTFQPARALKFAENGLTSANARAGTPPTSTEAKSHASTCAEDLQ